MILYFYNFKGRIPVHKKLMPNKEKQADDTQWDGYLTLLGLSWTSRICGLTATTRATVIFRNRRLVSFCFDSRWFSILQKNQQKIASPSVGDPDSHVFGPPGSGSISRRYGYGFGSGSFPFLIKVLSGLKQCLQNKILTQNCNKKQNF